MKHRIPILLKVCSAIVVVTVILAAGRFTLTRSLIGKEIRDGQYPRMENLGSTRTLVILPLFENAVSRESLAPGHGVAYLVITDRANILFDLGFDTQALLKNMRELHVSQNIDNIVISHNHPDHVGGPAWWSKGTFSLDTTQVDLGSRPVYVPTRLTYPHLTPIEVRAPQKIAEGVASLGTLPGVEIYKPTLFHTIVEEQALAVNVEGEGVVLITGCGHPGLEAIVDRAKMVFDAPVVGIVGGLHFTDQKIDTLQDEIRIIRDNHLRLLAISPHDSEAATIQIFRDAFPGIYRDIAVGKPIIFGQNL